MRRWSSITRFCLRLTVFSGLLFGSGNASGATDDDNVEWFGIYSSGLDDDYVISVFNIGLDHYLTDHLVIDFRAGVGLTDDSDDFFTGVGGGYRF